MPISYEVGRPKSLEDITEQDVRLYPIRLWVWEAGVEDEAEDETWQCPLLNVTDGTDDMTSPIMTPKVRGTDRIASAEFDPKKDELQGKSVWAGDAWTDLRGAQLAPPIVFTAVPTIRGVPDVEVAEAFRIGSDRAAGQKRRRPCGKGSSLPARPTTHGWHRSARGGKVRKIVDDP